MAGVNFKMASFPANGLMTQAPLCFLFCSSTQPTKQLAHGAISFSLFCLILFTNSGSASKALPNTTPSTLFSSIKDFASSLELIFPTKMTGTLLILRISKASFKLTAHGSP